MQGTLSISDGGNIKLELTQSFNPSIQAQFGYTRPDSLNPIGLIDTIIQKKKRSIVHGRLIAPDVIWANRAFMGFPYEEDTSPRFNTFSFSVERIDEWVGISGIEVKCHSEKRC